MRIAIFGGSFDPVHNGHVGIAKKALAELSLDKLFVIPAAVSPFKTSSSPRLSDDIRLECLYAAFAGVANVVIDTRELEKGGVSYAIDTVREYALEFPGAEIYFIIGEDSVEGLPRWKDYETLKTLCTFKAYPRTVESSTEVRRRLFSKNPIDDLVPDAVAGILRHNNVGPICATLA